MDLFEDKRNVVIPRKSDLASLQLNQLRRCSRRKFDLEDDVPLSDNPSAGFSNEQRSRRRSVVNFCLDHLTDRICGDLIAVESILIIGQSTFINTRYKKLPERGVMESHFFGRYKTS